MPQVGLEQEVEHVERFPIVFRVPHVHVVARADHAAVDLVRRIRLFMRAFHRRVGIAPHAVPVQERHLLVSRHLERKVGRGHERECRHRWKHGARPRLLSPPVRRAALATRRVDSAHHRASRHDGAAVLGRVACMLHAQTVVDAAVGNTRIVARGPIDHGVFDQLGIHARYLRHPLGSKLLQVLRPQIPCGTARMRTAVFELHFEFAGKRRIDKRIKLRQICDPASNLRLVVAQTRDVLSEARGLLRPRLTLPMSVFRVGLPVRPTMVELVVHEIAFRIAFAFNLPIDHGGIDISFGEQPRAILVRALRVLNCLGVSSRLHIGHDDERRIRPALHELPIHEIVLQDDMAPPQRHGVIGSGAQVQPILRRATKVRHAGVDHDECLGLARHIDDQTRGIVVVRDGGIGSPLHVLRRVVDNLAPRPRLNVVKTRREMARALAYLIRGHDVRCAEQLKRHAGI